MDKYIFTYSDGGPDEFYIVTIGTNNYRDFKFVAIYRPIEDWRIIKLLFEHAEKAGKRLKVRLVE